MEEVHTNEHPPFVFIFFLLLTALSGPFYFLFTLTLLRKHNIHIFNHYSFAEGIHLEWLRKLVTVFGVVWTLLIIITVIHHVFNLFSMAFCTDSLFVALSVFVIVIGYQGLKQKVIFENEFKEQYSRVNGKKIKYSGSSLKEEEAKTYAEQLGTFMRSEKPYLDPDLTLAQLASLIKISSHHLSQIINEKFGLNFFEYINHFRVEEVKARIIDPKFQNYFTILKLVMKSSLV
jgi:AraC-like DNA-binding protein